MEAAARRGRGLHAVDHRAAHRRWRLRRRRPGSITAISRERLTLVRVAARISHDAADDRRRRARRTRHRAPRLGQLLPVPAAQARRRPAACRPRTRRRRASDPVLVISHDYWQTRFGALALGHRVAASRQRRAVHRRRRRARAIPGDDARPRLRHVAAGDDGRCRGKGIARARRPIAARLHRAGAAARRRSRSRRAGATRRRDARSGGDLSGNQSVDARASCCRSSARRADRSA